MEHYAHGKLVARESMVPPPAPMTCLRLSCYLAFIKRVINYMILNEYHKRRVMYAERHKEDIPEHYRTGEPVPKHLLWEILKLRWR